MSRFEDRIEAAAMAVESMRRHVEGCGWCAAAVAVEAPPAFLCGAGQAVMEVVAAGEFTEAELMAGEVAGGEAN